MEIHTLIIAKQTEPPWILKGAEWSAFTGCSFDPRAGVIQTFKDAKKKSVYGFAQDIVDSAPTLVAAWGLNKLQENYRGVWTY